MAVVAWLSKLLYRVQKKAIPCVAQLYDKGILYRDTLKILVNFMQIVGSFARCAALLAHAFASNTCTGTHTYECTKACTRMYS